MDCNAGRRGMRAIRGWQGVEKRISRKWRLDWSIKGLKDGLMSCWENEANQNQLYQEWTQCNSCLQHVLSLVDKFKEERKAVKNFKASSLFCELLKDCQRYDNLASCPDLEVRLWPVQISLRDQRNQRAWVCVWRDYAGLWKHWRIRKRPLISPLGCYRFRPACTRARERTKAI